MNGIDADDLKKERFKFELLGTIGFLLRFADRFSISNDFYFYRIVFSV